MTGITIERDSHAQQFVIVHNYVARDMRLRREAKGLLVELLSLPPGRRITADILAEQGIEGRDAVRRMLRDLENAGYIVRSKDRDEAGRWRHRMIVRETPARNSPEPENPSLVSPAETRVSPAQTGDWNPDVGDSGVKSIKTVEPKTIKKTGRRRPPGAPAGDAGLQVPGLHRSVTRTREAG
jgi:hypothetical protein